MYGLIVGLIILLLSVFNVSVPGDWPRRSTYRYENNRNWAVTREERAVQTAQSYLRSGAFSYQGLLHQLEYEKFTEEQAKYGVDHCGADWYEQAVKEADSYLRHSDFTYSELFHQLEYEGFTYEEARYGVNNCSKKW